MNRAHYNKLILIHLDVKGHAMKSNSYIQRIFFVLFAGIFATYLSGCGPTYGYLQYSTYTGQDNLDGNKSAVIAFLTLNNGTQIRCLLNGNGGGQTLASNSLPPVPGNGVPNLATWNPDSVHTVVCPIGEQERVLFVGATLTVQLAQLNCQTFCDNWDLEGLSLALYQNNPQSSGYVFCTLKAGNWGPGDNGEHPAIARLKGGNGAPLGIFVSQTQTFTLPDGGYNGGC